MTNAQNRFSCPQCKSTAPYEAKLEGRRVKCKCGEIFRVQRTQGDLSRSKTPTSSTGYQLNEAPSSSHPANQGALKSNTTEREMRVAKIQSPTCNEAYASLPWLQRGGLQSRLIVLSVILCWIPGSFLLIIPPIIACIRGPVYYSPPEDHRDLRISPARWPASNKAGAYILAALFCFLYLFVIYDAFR